MKVSIKDFAVTMEIKSKGIEVDGVRQRWDSSW